MMSHEIPLRLCTVRIARDGFAMLTAEDEGQHPCLLPPSDEGGEA